MLPAYSYGEPAVLAFVVIPIALVVVLVRATMIAWRRAGAPPREARRAGIGVLLVAAAWMSLTFRAASTGLFLDLDRMPPPFAILFASILALAAWLAFGRVGTRLARHIPLWALVAVQGFRLPLELAMHQMAVRGIMPEHMSYTGWNFDIVTGVTAIVVGFLVWSGRGGRPLVLAWNVVGLGLLANIVTIAVVYDEEGKELGAWGPRPAPLQALFRARRAELGPPDEASLGDFYAPVMAWYAKDRGVTTLQELLMLLERGGEPR